MCFYPEERTTRAMNPSFNKYKLKGNESFDIREGWLNKGLSAIENNPSVFSRSEAADILGVGTKMVKSIRFWLLASGLVKERINRNAPRSLVITEDFGEIVMRYDRYFEDIFTLWLIHYRVVKNTDYCTVWYLFFNFFDAYDFTKATMADKFTDDIVNNCEKADRSIRQSVDSDCSSVIKMYNAVQASAEDDPEDNTSSPFADLGLVKRSGNEKGHYVKMKPVFDTIDRLVLLYIILDNMNEARSVSFDELMNGENNVGKVLNIDRNMLNDYLDLLRQDGYISINRTAGLDMVYVLDNITPTSIMERYYRQNQE